MPEREVDPLTESRLTDVFDNPWTDNHPAHPTITPIYSRGVMSSVIGPPPSLPYDIEWRWHWTDCNGDRITSTNEPTAWSCPQPGVCVVHDPPDTIVPW
jgi:hypothetical protein